jgi:hypothetical protein
VIPYLDIVRMRTADAREAILHILMDVSDGTKLARTWVVDDILVLAEVALRANDVQVELRERSESEKPR